MSQRLNVVKAELDEDQPLFEQGGEFDEKTFFEVFDDAIRSIEAVTADYLVMGGVASAAIGRPRWTHDIDIFIRPEHAEAILASMVAAGFETQKTYPDWLFKGLKDGVLVDLIFRSQGNIYLDDEMLEHAQGIEFKNRTLRVISAEDLLVIKAVVHDEHLPRHWHDALGLVARFEMDWEYLLKRAHFGARRVLSLLIYAQSNDLIVPHRVISSLFEMVYGEGTVQP